MELDLLFELGLKALEFEFFFAKTRVVGKVFGKTKLKL
jgi:hypothetical protein